MKHTMHILILLTVLTVVVVASVFTANFQVATEPGGYFHFLQRSTPADNVCFDTDGGANQFVRGAIRYQDWSFLDDCAIVTVESDNISILYEGYCADASRPTIVQYNCTKGCENGACII